MLFLICGMLLYYEEVSKPPSTGSDENQVEFEDFVYDCLFCGRVWKPSVTHGNHLK